MGALRLKVSHHHKIWGIDMQQQQDKKERHFDNLGDALRFLDDEAAAAELALKTYRANVSEMLIQLANEIQKCHATAQ